MVWVQNTLIPLLLYLSKPRLAYKISTVDSAGVCNETIWLEDGAKSAAILRLTAKDFYDFAPLHCQITFKAPKHTWSGLTGVLEEVDLRRYEDTTGHHLAQNECLDYIMVVSDTRTPQERQCGSWAVTGQEQLTHLGYRRSLVGYCPLPLTNDPRVIRCGMTELTVEVSVGQQDNHYLWRDTHWRPHRGFTFVVTAYRYSYHESGCDAGFRSCGTTDRRSKHHCVHQSLWCDHHINCGQPHNYDELSCLDDEMLGGLVMVIVGPWIGAFLLLVVVLGGVLYWRRGRTPARREHPPPQELNSYAESYEVSSTLSSAHHMAIQVRVVCNSGQGIYTQRTHPWQAADLPPSYDSLFPQGLPSPKFSTTTSTATTPATNSAASFDITTTSLLSLGSNTNASPVTSAFFSNTTQTSNIVIPINAICSTLGATSEVSTPSCATTTFTTAPVYSSAATGVSPSSSNTPKTASTSAASSSTAPPATLPPPFDLIPPLVVPEDTNMTPSHAVNSTPSHAVNSTPSHAVNSTPSHAVNSTPSHAVNSTPSHAVNSTPSHAVNSTPSHAVNSTCSHSGSSSPYRAVSLTAPSNATASATELQPPLSDSLESEPCEASRTHRVEPLTPGDEDKDTTSQGRRSTASPPNGSPEADEIPGATEDIECLQDAFARPDIPVDTGQASAGSDTCTASEESITVGSSVQDGVSKIPADDTGLETAIISFTASGPTVEMGETEGTMTAQLEILAETISDPK
ncbi:uncharacterized protein [Procambarus clarkii]|uniref:uncharacterized protein n=1 Tax=Procambarus clarkii TaxID=6728 RepID=UPI003744763F